MQLRLVRAVELVQTFVRWGGAAPGFREIDGWSVADGADAAHAAIERYHQAGGLAPIEITAMAYIVALYGGQAAFSDESVVLMIPEGLPDHLIHMAGAAGYGDLVTDRRAYRALIWPR